VLLDPSAVSGRRSHRVTATRATRHGPSAPWHCSRNLTGTINEATLSFEDSAKLLAAADAMQLEGIVSKRRDGRYRSGTRSGWIKVKASAWREANRERGSRRH
jgi:hypothetical protein